MDGSLIEQEAVTGSTSIILRGGLVTISGNLDDEVPRGTLNSILKQSGLKEIGKDD
jgi:predicted RNA binding protein YcfA (HicA-like mRNA interferase family)